MADLKLKIVSQERQLVDTVVSQVIAPASMGEITVLPYHAPLFTRLDDGILRYVENNTEHNLVVSRGFLTVNPKNEITVMVDAASLEREISLDKAQQAIDDAKKQINDKTLSERELIQAEAAMRKAMWEIRLAQRSRKSSF